MPEILHADATEREVFRVRFSKRSTAATWYAVFLAAATRFAFTMSIFSDRKSLFLNISVSQDETILIRLSAFLLFPAPLGPVPLDFAILLQNICMKETIAPANINACSIIVIVIQKVLISL
jgi:hypothetical protein